MKSSPLPPADEPLSARLYDALDALQMANDLMGHSVTADLNIDDIRRYADKLKREGK